MNIGILVEGFLPEELSFYPISLLGAMEKDPDIKLGVLSLSDRPESDWPLHSIAHTSTYEELVARNVTVKYTGVPLSNVKIVPLAGDRLVRFKRWVSFHDAIFAFGASCVMQLRHINFRPKAPILV
ncbi:MAG TPA: hypothetical protein VNG90_05450, partial [Candidatus Acidoferrum sp.]|nr:hypothetical protein [Candidatus Acidoferrum sp.]